MHLKQLVEQNRSYRRFYQDMQIGHGELMQLIELARLSPCGANKQGLRFFLSTQKESNALIYKHLHWAGYYKDWDGPSEGEKPSAYIIILKDTLNGTMLQDEGIAAQSIMLGAVEKGMGGCIIANVERKKLQAALNLADNYAIALVLALGYPKERVTIDEITAGSDIKYWRDEDEVQHVPKICLQDLIVN